MSNIASKRKDPTPIACNLDADAFSGRLTALAEFGDAFLVSREKRDDRHLLRFRAEPDAHRRLEEIVAAESECCAFLDLSLREEGDEIVLSIGSPAAGRPAAEEFANAFSRTGEATGNGRRSRGRRVGTLLSAGGLAVAVCCLALPAAFRPGPGRQARRRRRRDRGGTRRHRRRHPRPSAAPRATTRMLLKDVLSI